MKHAYLILVHNEPYILNVLLSKLYFPDNKFFVHIDRKISDLIRNELRLIVNKWGGVILNDVDIYWGDFSLVEAELLLYKTALHYPIKFDYFHLLSGVDLPIKKLEYIQSFFENNAEKEYFRIADDVSNRSQIDIKTNYYYFFMKYSRSTSLISKIIRYLHIPGASIQFQKMCGINRGNLNGMRFYKGDEWCSLTRNAVMWILEQEKWIRKRFRFTCCPDEIYKQTILMNSPFKDKVFVPILNQNAAIRLIDWNRENPYVWTMDDVDLILDDNNLFARKFSSKHMEIIDFLADI